ncbi:MAG: tRNA (adenosine(37)-N6)-threonylcarbamoyltransferase complex ATPase subunit type 1 TsaE [Firmicutes bacterium]|nr:tRNA (adenosine(37)-N6)-threonylcarbamoyltransferase complex ATPase subunit type 1 TsaE [Bacillota bacterium]
MLELLTMHATVYLLTGEMGAGKTHFVKSMYSQATSPTFTIVNYYEPNIYHLDLYRIEEEEEYLHLGLEEILTGDNVVFIEWAQKLPSHYLGLIKGLIKNVKIVKLENDERQIIVHEHRR